LLPAATSVIGVFLYQNYVVSPEREMVIKRYDEFRAALVEKGLIKGGLDCQSKATWKHVELLPQKGWGNQDG
jgi:hypothetical protein